LLNPIPDPEHLHPAKDKGLHFFSYEISEALHMSDKEKQIFQECVQKLDGELHENIDVHSQAIIVPTIELLLNYCLRFMAGSSSNRAKYAAAPAPQADRTG